MVVVNADAVAEAVRPGILNAELLPRTALVRYTTPCTALVRVPGTDVARIPRAAYRPMHFTAGAKAFLFLLFGILTLSIYSLSGGSFPPKFAKSSDAAPSCEANGDYCIEWSGPDRYDLGIVHAMIHPDIGEAWADMARFVGYTTRADMGQ